MDLIDVINAIVQRNVGVLQPADLYIGTVTSIDPLAVKIDESQAEIRKEILYKTDAVIERKIPDLKHTHKVPGGSTGSADGHSHSIPEKTTDEALKDLKSCIDGKPQDIQDGYIVINKGLAAGDKVLLLSVQQGQKFIILSHLWEG